MGRTHPRYTAGQLRNLEASIYPRAPHVIDKCDCITIVEWGIMISNIVLA